MYHRVRQTHRWVGLVACLFLVLIASTGFLLAIKGRVDALRPPVGKSLDPGKPPVATVGQAMEAALSKRYPELSSIKQIDRVDYRPKDNVYKVLSKEGYREIQVDGATGKIVSDGLRRDAWIEDLHDFSFFDPLLHQWGLPVVAIGLLMLALSGVGIFFVPVWRRRQYQKSKGRSTSPKSTA